LTSTDHALQNLATETSSAHLNMFHQAPASAPTAFEPPDLRGLDTLFAHANHGNNAFWN
jgi:hypothetical protein